MTEFETLSASDEMDLEGEGIQTIRADFTITNAEVEDLENGRTARITFENLEVFGGPITRGFWLTHENEKAVRVGRGQLKTIGKHVLGTQKYALSQLIGESISAELYDNDGFADLRRYRKASGDAEVEAVAEAAL